MSDRDLYADLGVRRVINAATTLTALGGTVLAPEVVEAMIRASTSCVSMEELHLAAGRRLAELTRNDAALVTAGAAAAMGLAVLAAITGGDPATIARLPSDRTLERRVIVHGAHRIPYDRAVELVGGEIVQVGNVIQTFDWELESALESGAAAVLWVAGDHLPPGALDLATTVRLAHAHGVSVLVDAAAQLPPLANLWHFTRDLGADLAFFSGGKDLRGPQSSGLLVGRADLVEAARLNAAPFQRLARAMKVGKEEIAGLVAAVERYVALDHGARARTWDSQVDAWSASLAGVDDVVVSRHDTNEAGQPVPRVEVRCASPARVRAVVEILGSRDPRIAVLEVGSSFFLSPDVVEDGAHDQVIAAVRDALSMTKEEVAHVG